LLLPVSNLTNLLAVQRLGLSTTAFAARMALPELVAVAITVTYLGLLYRHDLTGRYDPPQPVPPADRVVFWVCAAVFAWRQRRDVAWSLLPWRLVIFTEGLFLAVTALARHGGTQLLTRLVGHSALATALVAGAASNAVNNLPAYLAVETTVSPGHTTQLLAALLGTNVGLLVLLWGSLATLLWRERCKARGLEVSPARFAVIGLGGVPLILLGTWGALMLAGR
jgi:arsenical pump membrane protein